MRWDSIFASERFWRASNLPAAPFLFLCVYQHPNVWAHDWKQNSSGMWLITELLSDIYWSYIVIWTVEFGSMRFRANFPFNFVTASIKFPGNFPFVVSHHYWPLPSISSCTHKAFGRPAFISLRKFALPKIRFLQLGPNSLCKQACIHQPMIWSFVMRR